jgi:hypothetical protein
VRRAQEEREYAGRVVDSGLGGKGHYDNKSYDKGSTMPFMLENAKYEECHSPSLESPLGLTL